MRLSKKKSVWIVLGIVVVVGLLAILRRPAKPLTREEFVTAQELWQRQSIRDYDLSVSVSGVQTGEHKITVRHGQVSEMTTNGVEVPKRVWPYWTIEGMFRFIDEELSEQQRPQGAYGVSQKQDVFLDADFDEALGYPKRFLRQVFGRNLTIEWKVRFSRRGNGNAKNHTH